MASSPFRVLIAGGGVAALEAVLTFGDMALNGALQIDVVAPERRFVYRPLSVRDPFGPRATRAYDLQPIVEGAGARLHHGQVDAVEPDDRVVTLGDGTQLGYDALLLATGVVRRPGIPGASTFSGAPDAPAFHSFVESLCHGAYRRVAFVVPPGPTWGLPMYELALQAGARLRETSVQAQLAVISPERSALAVFGPVASHAVETLMHEHGVTMHPGTYAESVTGGRLRLDMQGSVQVDAAWSAARYAPRVPLGVPLAPDGFVATDALGRVEGFVDLFAAGDVTTGPAKQGGIAAQQAATAAEAIAALGDLRPEPEPRPPVLRAMLLTGGEPLWLRADPSSDVPSEAAHEPLWWPPHKIFGAHLAPVLAKLEERPAPV
jgi:sulfide:quinone oxidoreductase